MVVVGIFSPSVIGGVWKGTVSLSPLNRIKEIMQKCKNAKLMFYIYDKQSVICFVHLQIFASPLQNGNRQLTCKNLLLSSLSVFGVSVSCVARKIFLPRHAVCFSTPCA
jgi:hypothetical protein